MKLEKIKYSKLNSKQKENYNYQKLSSILADFGYTTIPLNDDYLGADFLAIHCFSQKIFKIQLKGRLTFYEEYLKNDDLLVCFPYNEQWYIYNHKDFYNEIIALKPSIINTNSWKKGKYSWKVLTNDLLQLVKKIE